MPRGPAALAEVVEATLAVVGQCLVPPAERDVAEDDAIRRGAKFRTANNFSEPLRLLRAQRFKSHASAKAGMRVGLVLASVQADGRDRSGAKGIERPSLRRGHERGNAKRARPAHVVIA